MFKSLENSIAGEVAPNQDTFEYLLGQMTFDELTAAKGEYQEEIKQLTKILDGVPEGQNWKGELSLKLAKDNLAAVEKLLTTSDTTSNEESFDNALRATGEFHDADRLDAAKKRGLFQ